VESESLGLAKNDLDVFWNRVRNVDKHSRRLAISIIHQGVSGAVAAPETASLSSVQSSRPTVDSPIQRDIISLSL
jgi:hypothetical protein